MQRTFLVLSLFTICHIVTANAVAQDPTDRELELFSSAEGGFQVLFPGTPNQNVEGSGEFAVQQLLVGGAAGVYIATYESIPEERTNTPEKLADAYSTGIAAILKGFGGKLLESKEVAIGDDLGRQIRATIPGRQGEARIRLLLAGGRLYSIRAMGAGDFANTDNAKRIVESFQRK